MTIHLQSQHLDTIRQHGEEAFPNECCGFMLGDLAGSEKTVKAIKRADNMRDTDDRRHRFLIDPEAMLAIERQARSDGCDIVGFYHSHPDAEAKPSEYDRAHAWPVYSYVIVSVREGVAEATTSWVLDAEASTFEEEQIINERS